MKLLRAFLLRLRGLAHTRRSDQDFEEELESHLALHIADNLRLGMPLAEARRVALVKLGASTTAVREARRERSTLPWVENCLLDLRFTLRQFARNPAFTATAVIVLSLGICASSSIFSFVDAALLKPLPYREPARLVAVNESSRRFPRNNLSYLDYLDWKRLNTVFESLDVYTGSGFLLRTSTGAERVNAVRVSAGFFNTLGVIPALGRTFRSGEDVAHAARMVVLTHRFWRQRFAGSPDIVGRKLLLSGEPYTVIGVLPASFSFAPRGDAVLWTTIDPTAGCESRRSCHNLDGVARLRPGITVEAAQSELKTIAYRLEQQYPGSNTDQSARIEDLSRSILGPLRSVLLLLLCGALLLLTIAVANVVSLVLVRSEARRQEIAVRASLGASRSRLILQSFTEGVVLTFVATLLGLALTTFATTLLLKLIPAGMKEFLPFLSPAGLNGHVLLFTACIGLVTTTAFSVVPLLFLPGDDSRSGMVHGGRWSAGLTWRRLGSKLVIGELAGALVLVIVAGLLSKSLYLLLRVDVGFSADHLAAVSVAGDGASYKSSDQQVALARQVLTAASAVPGIRNAAVTSVLPVSCNCNTDWIRVAGKPFDGHHEDVNERDVSPDYFVTLGAKLLRGRYFTDAEDKSRPNVAIVNRAFVQKYFSPGEDPIGRQFGDLSLTPGSLRQIIGIVDDIHEGSLESEIWPAEYLPFNQSADNVFNLIVRSQQDERTIIPALRTAIHRAHPDLGLSNETSLGEYISDSLTAYLHRSCAWLVGGFAALALFLSIVGLYGVVAYSVSRRTREIGVRMALGAGQSFIYRLILAEAARLIAVGVVVGLVASFGASRALRTLFFGVHAWDPATLSVVTSVLALAAFLATFSAARRAARVNPVDALRVE